VVKQQKHLELAPSICGGPMIQKYTRSGFKKVVPKLGGAFGEFVFL